MPKYDSLDNRGLSPFIRSWSVPVYPFISMLAFLVDQALQLCCALFNAVWQHRKSKRALWEGIRGMFMLFDVDSMESLRLKYTK
nr:hypothetical protein [Desulfobulbaceae bacterium]